MSGAPGQNEGAFPKAPQFAPKGVLSLSSATQCNASHHPNFAADEISCSRELETSIHTGSLLSQRMFIECRAGPRPGGPRALAPGGFAAMQSSLPAQNGLPARPQGPPSAVPTARPLGPGLFLCRCNLKNRYSSKPTAHMHKLQAQHDGKGHRRSQIGTWAVLIPIDFL